MREAGGYAPDVREQNDRPALEAAPNHTSRWAAIRSEVNLGDQNPLEIYDRQWREHFGLGIDRGGRGRGRRLAVVRCDSQGRSHGPLTVAGDSRPSGIEGLNVRAGSCGFFRSTCTPDTVRKIGG